MKLKYANIEQIVEFEMTHHSILLIKHRQLAHFQQRHHNTSQYLFSADFCFGFSGKEHVINAKQNTKHFLLVKII